MLFNVIKILTSAMIIGAITALSKRYPALGGSLAALPLISILSILWLSLQGSSTIVLSEFTRGVILGLPATAVFLIAVYITLKYVGSLPVGLFAGVLFWFLTYLVIKRLGLI